MLILTFASMNAQSKSEPKLRLESGIDKLVFYAGNQQFITKEVRFFNKGGGVLTIDSVVASCSCGNGRTLLGNVEPLGFGKLFFTINVKELANVPSMLYFTIYSNSKDSPLKLRAEILP